MGVRERFGRAGGRLAFQFGDADVLGRLRSAAFRTEHAMMMRPVEAGQGTVIGRVTDRVAARALDLPTEHAVERARVEYIVGPGL